eukprot:13978981-Heterocapsa_arctica.AAC.1
MPTGAWCARRRTCHPVRRFHGRRFLQHIVGDDHFEEDPIEDRYVAPVHASAYLAVALGITQAPE